MVDAVGVALVVGVVVAVGVVIGTVKGGHVCLLHVARVMISIVKNRYR